MMVYKNFINLLINFKLGTLSSPHPTRWLITLMAILPFLGLSKGRLVSLLRVARGEPLTETQRHGENFLLGTPTSSSASSPRSGFTLQVSAFSFVPHVCWIKAHRSRSGYRHGFERTLDYCSGVVQCGGVIFGGASQESIPDVNHSMGKSVFETSNALWEISK